MATEPQEITAAHEEWEAYAKHRYESRRGALVEYRSWARQLMQVMGVVIALEVTLFGRMIDNGFSIWNLVPLGVLLVTITYQIILLDMARQVGYNLASFQHPAAPKDLLVRESVEAMRQAIAAEYSTAYDERDAESAAVGQEVRGLGAGFASSLFRGLLGTIFLVFAFGFVQRLHESGFLKSAWSLLWS